MPPVKSRRRGTDSDHAGQKREGYGRATLVPSPLVLMVKVPAATLAL
jgi:hypothetical protein